MPAVIGLPDRLRSGEVEDMPDGPADLKVVPIDLTSDEQLRAFWEVEQAAQRADRDDPILRGFNAFVTTATTPSAYSEHTWLLARSGDSVLGVAELSMSTEDNSHLGEVEVNVRPDARRTGVGRALHDEVIRRARDFGRSTLTGEVMAPDESGSAAAAFANAVGYRTVHTEHHLGLPLPVAPERVATLGTTDPAYEMVTWEGACPDELRPAYLAMRNQMNADVPSGELDHEPVVLDDDRLASQEERTGASYVALVAAARERRTGDLTGYSLIYLPKDDDSLAWQDDTLVMPSHRGRRLGLALKRTNLECLAEEHPARRAIHTWTDPQNGPMYRTNEKVGFTLIEVMYEMELTLS